MTSLKSKKAFPATLEQRKQIARRLQNLRKNTVDPEKNKPYTQDSLADALGRSTPTIINWERSNGNNFIPSYDQLIDLANLYKCEIGYLLCEQDCKTRSATDIHKETGLSEESIEKLRLWKDDKRFMNGLEHLITSQYAVNLLYAISDTISQCYSEKDYWKFKNEYRTPQLKKAYENAQNDGLSGIASPYNMLLEMEVTPKTLAEYTLQKYITLLIDDKIKNNKGGNENELQP